MFRNGLDRSRFSYVNFFMNFHSNEYVELNVHIVKLKLQTFCTNELCYGGCSLLTLLPIVETVVI